MQSILPVIEYADVMVESGPAYKNRMAPNTTIEWVMHIIDNREHPDQDPNELSNHYRTLPLKLHRNTLAVSWFSFFLFSSFVFNHITYMLLFFHLYAFRKIMMMGNTEINMMKKI